MAANIGCMFCGTQRGLGQRIETAALQRSLEKLA
jgi:hypothetical protein